ncbi:ABC transporter permease [Phreatobacter aquaticus]|uniref:ABC transporter permease n=1 Tax=Phreatobacter aquaticus TaxID=2570229 RepID=A0A4D7QQG4_9HYPH|nr:ABC transporter permease [Phreatobacter aquaticus]QCK87856.1 ABC transporter permease [Phreatobacter aquaticus]
MTARDRFRMIGRRTLQFVPVLILSTLVVFSLLQLVPGDPAITLAGESASPARIAEIRQMYGLDQPLPMQYVQWVGKVVRGDLSNSLLSSEKVSTLIAQRFPSTLLIVVLAVLISLAIGIPLGIAAATREGSRTDIAITTLTSVGIALPSFWLAMILVAWLALDWQWFPATGSRAFSEDPLGALRHAILPALALAAGGIAEVTRQLRSSLIAIRSSQFMRTLRAKGLSPTRIVWVHGLKNVAVNLLTVTGLLINRTLGATVVIEAVFAIPGIGSLMVNAAVNKDFPVVQGLTLMLVVLVIAVNLAIDIAYTFVDPRLGRKP